MYLHIYGRIEYCNDGAVVFQNQQEIILLNLIFISIAMINGKKITKVTSYTLYICCTCNIYVL